MAVFENAFALVIGIDNYHYVPALCKAANDARDVHSLLTDPDLCGYRKENARLLLDRGADVKAFWSAMEWLAGVADGESAVTIFFSGHGAQAWPDAMENNFVLLVDSNPWRNRTLDVEQLRATAVSGQALTGALNRIQSKKLTVILDACHSGGLANPRNPFFNPGFLQRGLSQQTHDLLQQGEGRAVLASCKPGQRSWERTGIRNSIFTDALLAGLRGAAAGSDAGVSVFSLFAYLSKAVPERAATIVDPSTNAPVEQNPYFKAELVQDYILALARPHVPAPPVERPQYDVFISYSHADSEAVGKLVDRLRQDGFSVWLDEDELGGGDPLGEVLVRGIENSSHVIACLSESYLKSKWGKFEAAIAQTMDPDAQKRRLIPVKIAPCEIPTAFKWLYTPDLSAAKQWERAYKKAVKNIRRLRAERGDGEPPDIAPVPPAGEKVVPGRALATPSFEVQFDNREFELMLVKQQVADPGTAPYIYICSPAQTGKTFMLRELQKRHHDQPIEWKHTANGSPPVQWHCAYVDLAQVPGCAEDFRQVTAAITAALGDRPAITPHDLAITLQKLRVNSRRAMLLLDSAECLSDCTAGELHGLLRELETRYIRQPAYLPAVVAASRRHFPAWEQAYKPLIGYIALTDFSEAVVTSLLKKAVDHRGFHYDDAWYEAAASQIAQCGAGHPGCIAALVRYFHAEFFITPDLNADDVFVQCVIPIIENAILTSQNLRGRKPEVDVERLARVLVELSVYRLITPAHIDVATAQLGLVLSAAEKLTLEDEIRECLLVEQDPENGWPYLPFSIRRLLERSLALAMGDAHGRHREAAERYDGWLNNKEESSARNPLSGSSQATYIREALFHYASAKAPSGPDAADELENKLRAYFTDLRPSFPGQRMRVVLYNQMSKDRELREVVERCAGAGAYDRLLNVV